MRLTKEQALILLTLKPNTMKTKIKTFEDACKALKLNPKKVLPDVSCYPKEHHAAVIAHLKLIIIAKALNGKWVPDWNNFNEYKYYPWFRMSAGFGFSYYVYFFDYSAAHVGSRLCFKTSALAKYAGEQFSDLYKDYMTL